MAESSRLKQIQEEVVSSASDDAQVQGDPAKARWHRSFIHFWTLVGTFFWRNRCQVRASALAYTTLLALVPLLAVSISMLVVFKSGDAENRINVWIEELVQHVAPTLGLSDQLDANSARKAVVTNIVSYVGNIRFGTIGVTAMAGLVFAAISLMRTIEAAFNDIWGASSARSWWNSILLYWGVMTLGPAVLVIVTTSSYVRAGVDHVSWIKEMPLIGVLNTALLPIGTLTVAFGLFYLLMPNTRVEARSAAVGALVAAALWWANSQLGAFYNTRVVAYSKIYGSLGAVPLFLLGLYFSWLILLFGAQVAYVYQNRHAYLQERQAEKIHQQGREFAALRIITEIARRFSAGERPVGASALSNRLGIPPKLASTLLKSLADARLVTGTSGPEAAYVPARPIEQISVHSVLIALRTANGEDLVTAEDSLRDVVRSELTAVRLAESDRADDLTLADLVKKV
jgi:membrane protein